MKKYQNFGVLALGALFVATPLLAAPNNNATAQKNTMRRDDQRLERRENGQGRGVNRDRANRDGANNRGERGTSHRGGMMQSLNLTPQQKEQIRPILSDMREAAREIRQNETLSQEEKRARMLTLREQTFRRVSPYLTAQQREQLQQMKEQRGSRGMGNKSGYGHYQRRGGVGQNGAVRNGVGRDNMRRNEVRRNNIPRNDVNRDQVYPNTGNVVR